MDLYGVIGNPISHSKSPQIYNSAFKQLGIDAHYLRIASIDVEHAVRSINQLGLKGFNITSPYKRSILDLLDQYDPDALINTRAVNTVVLEAGKLTGYNTDGYGAFRALKEAGAKPLSHNFLILGAGGAAEALAYELRSKGAEIMIANRSQGPAKEMADKIECGYITYADPGFEDEVGNADVIASCVPTFEPIVPKDGLREGQIVMDGNYARKSALVGDAREKGATLVSGLEWLLYQGVKAFEIFTGRDAPVEIMRKALYAGMRNEAEGSERASLTDPSKPSNISLLGPMGSGKTTIGKTLSGRVHKTFVDTDSEIEERLGKTISEIFSGPGEQVFRDYEQRITEEVLALEGQVISLGGGAVLNSEIVDRVNRRSCSFLLWASVEELVERLQDKTDRPLLEGSLKEKLFEVVTERFEKYVCSADVVVDTTDHPIEDITGLIENEVHTTG